MSNRIREGCIRTIVGRCCRIGWAWTSVEQKITRFDMQARVTASCSFASEPNASQRSASSRSIASTATVFVGEEASSTDGRFPLRAFSIRGCPVG